MKLKYLVSMTQSLIFIQKNIQAKNFFESKNDLPSLPFIALV